MRRSFAVLAGLLVAACVPSVRSEAVPSVLAGTLQVELARDTAWLTLHVTNPTTRPVLLEYRSGQRFDFELRTPAGAPVWRWSQDRMFAQVLSEESVGAGESLSHRVGVPLPAPGEYVAVGRLSAANERLELSTAFQVPARQAPER